VYLIVCLLIGAVLKHVAERAGRVASLGQPVATASNSTSSNFRSCSAIPGWSSASRTRGRSMRRL